MNWMISANSKMYDHAAAFQKWGYIDWRQKAKYSVGDIVYIYCTRPYMRVMYKTVVLESNLTSSEIRLDECYWHMKEEYKKSLGGYFSRLKLIEQVDSKFLQLSYLK